MRVHESHLPLIRRLHNPVNITEWLCTMALLNHRESYQRVLDARGKLRYSNLVISFCISIAWLSSTPLSPSCLFHARCWIYSPTFCPTIYLSRRYDLQLVGMSLSNFWIIIAVWEVKGLGLKEPNMCRKHWRQARPAQTLSKGDIYSHYSSILSQEILFCRIMVTPKRDNYTYQFTS